MNAAREPLPVLLTPHEMAARLRVSPMTVYRLIHAGEIRAKRVGRAFRIPESAANEYLRDAEYVAGEAL